MMMVMPAMMVMVRWQNYVHLGSMLFNFLGPVVAIDERHRNSLDHSLCIGMPVD